ncbi:GNAT family N-acetyltransferase [Nannocystis sp. SCPEA4]|uniref:GNAT family N-acetyltransferase n=1 Tax=Nannocystis sp. SCPEA4 TaxID=2996787 RepID=UPI002271A547|nr:GNAT family N-acetyltransferase [Nannocystis sp. SCPEA4]MCY1060468.1 GNAT family N-acetyltransferase [Nannocystis sp. SCPEA4]
MHEPDARPRLARLDEVEQVRDIERRSASRFLGTERAALADDEPTDAETLRRRIAEAGLWVVEDESGSPVAFVMFREVEGCGYVEQIDVLPEHARRRLGARLLDTVAAVGRTRGWPALLLSTFKDVPWNAPYYRRLGFVDLDDAVLGRELLQIRAEHEARGLDETARVFMRRALG